MTEPASTPPRSLLREAAIVFRHELRRLALSVRTLLPMGVYAGFGALAVAIFVAAADKTTSELNVRIGDVPREDVQRVTEELVGRVLSFTGWGDTGTAAEIFRDRVPLLVLYFFVLGSYFLPMLVALVSFDQFTELSTRGARFALLRVRRSAYFAGRAAASVASVGIFLAVAWAVVGGVAAARGGSEALPDALRESARAWLLMFVLALPYLSLTAIISAVARPSMAFVATLGAWIGLSLGASVFGSLLPWLLNRNGFEGAAAAVRRVLVLFPWEHAPLLVSRHLPSLLRGVGALLVLAALGYAAALYVVRRRDV